MSSGGNRNSRNSEDSEYIEGSGGSRNSGDSKATVAPSTPQSTLGWCMDLDHLGIHLAHSSPAGALSLRALESSWQQSLERLGDKPTDQQVWPLESGSRRV